RRRPRIASAVQIRPSCRMPTSQQPDRPLIAVIGSLNPAREYQPPVRSVELGAAACRELGGALAQAGCDLLIFSSKPAYVEADVVAGYVAVATVDDPGRVVARPPKGATVSFDLPVESGVSLQVEPDTSGEWELAYYRSLLRSDGVLLVGGGQSTRIAGIVAMTQEIPLIPVAAFGGGASQVWVNLDRHRNDALDEDIVTMGQPWGRDSATRLVASLLGQRKRRLERQRAEQRSLGRAAVWARVGLAVAFLALCAALAAIPLARTGGPVGVSGLGLLLAGPMAAAVAAAVIRNSFDGPDQWGWAAVRGLGAGVVSVLLYVASQLLTVPGLLADLDARRLLFFVVPLGFTAGFTFDLVFERLRSGQVSTPPNAGTPAGAPSTGTGG
ncbi:MAG TPA: hypothetical protein VGD43_13065, partial [Micromonospora sp.]